MRYSGGGIAIFKKFDDNVFVLLGKRKYNPFSRRWTFPGGAAEKNESLLQAGLRELKEETGIRLDKTLMTKVGRFKIDAPFFRWQTTIIETSQDLTFHRCHEFTDMKWILVDEIKNHPLHPFVKTVVRLYKKKKPLTLTKL